MSDDPSSKDPPGGRPADYLPYGVDTIVIPFTWSDRQEVPVSGDPSSQDLLPEGRSASHLPYGVDTIVIPFTWSGPQRRRLPWRRFGGYKWVTGTYPPNYVGQRDIKAAQQFSTALQDARQTSTELAISALQTLRGSSHNFYPHDAGTAAVAGGGLSTSNGTGDGGLTLIRDKFDGKDDPLHGMRKDLGEGTPEEEEQEVEHHGINPLHVHGIPSGGGALLPGAGRPDARSSLPAPRPASSTPAARPPLPSPPAPPPTPDEPARALPGHGNEAPQIVPGPNRPFLTIPPRGGSRSSESAGSSGTQADLITELVSKGAKVTPPNVVAATRMPDGNIAFLERGNSKSGLQHIVEQHGAEFAQAGIPEGKIPDFLTQALKNGKVVGQQSRRGGRPIYEVSYEGGTLRVAITVGSNGYIVGANVR